MYRIGIDLGGTNIAVGVVNDRYEIVARRSVPTGAERPAEEVIRDMGDAVEEALRQAGLTAADCASMGVGSPGACDPQTGVVKRAYNLNWFDVPVCRMLHQRFGIPVRLGNDANCAALAEVVAGAAVGCQDMVLITLGTGVGSGIISRGKILSGLRGGAGEAGHMLLVLDGEPCTCGRRGCWEAYASATALIRQTRQAALAHPESLLAQVEEITGRTAFDAAQQGDATAAEVVARYAVYVAAGLTDFVNILAPEMILLGAASAVRGGPAGPCPGVCGHPLFRSAGRGHPHHRRCEAGQRGGHHRRRRPVRACGFSTKRGGISIGNTSSLCAAGCQRIRWWFVWFCRWVDFLLITSGGLLFPAAFFLFLSPTAYFLSTAGKVGKSPILPLSKTHGPGDLSGAVYRM